MKYVKVELLAKVINYYWHGTDLKNLQSILKKGLVADKSDRSKYQHYNESYGNLKSIHGIYLASNIKTAKRYSNMGRTGSLLVYIQASMDNESFAIDEDRIRDLFLLSGYHLEKEYEDIGKELHKCKEYDIIEMSQKLDDNKNKISILSDFFINFVLEKYKLYNNQSFKKDLILNKKYINEFIICDMINSISSCLARAYDEDRLVRAFEVDKSYSDKLLTFAKEIKQRYFDSLSKIDRLFGRYISNLQDKNNDIAYTIARDKDIGYKGNTRILSVWAEYDIRRGFDNIPCYAQVFGDTKYNKLMMPEGNLGSNLMREGNYYYHVNPYFHGYHEYKILMDIKDDYYGKYLEYIKDRKPYF